MVILNFFTDILLYFNLIHADPPKQFIKCAKEVGGKIFENKKKMLGKNTIAEEVEYFLPDEAQPNIEEQVEEATSSSYNEEYEPPTKIASYDRVPFVKLKIVMTANEHPK